MADFTGFYLDGIHSSTYGILRVSDGDRYKEGLVPEFEDRDIELSGGSGSIYVNTQYKKTPFEINIAFEHLTEQQFRDIRKWLGGEKLHSFQFDERPYKTYWVKLESRPELEYVCFMEESKEVIGQEERIYKGEGTLNFVAYDPFGYCIDNSTQMAETGLEKVINGINWQVLDSYSPFTVLDNNVDEWGLASGLKNEVQLSEYNVFTKETSGETTDYIAKIYNPGDFETDFELFVKLAEQEDDFNEGYDGEILEDILTYSLSESDNTYTIMECKKTIQGKFIIPSTYKGLPISTIGLGSFSNCTLLTEIIIPDNITSILGLAFSGCSNLSSVTIGSNVSFVGGYAFLDCSSLANINLNAQNPPKFFTDTFNGVPLNCKIKVPKDSIKKYQEQAYLKDRADYIVSIGQIESVVVNIQIISDNQEEQYFIFSLKELETTDNVLLNTKKHSLTIYHFNKTKSLRYDLIKSTHWPKIPIGESTIKITCGLSNLVPQIKYNYKYY